MSIDDNKLKNILEAALMAVGKPMTVEQLQTLFDEDEQPTNSRIVDALTALQVDSEGRGIELKQIASGYRYQARQEFSEWISRLWEEKPTKYSRAYLETLALIAYRQPVTRAEIEDVRGVSVSSNIVKTMLERDWIRVVGHRDVPGRPSLYATTRQFLDYFNMKSLDELPSLAEIRDLDELSPELELTDPNIEQDDTDSDADAEVGLDSDGLDSEQDGESATDDSFASDELEEDEIDNAAFDDDAIDSDAFDGDSADDDLADIDSSENEELAEQEATDGSDGNDIDNDVYENDSSEHDDVEANNEEVNEEFSDEIDDEIDEQENPFIDEFDSAQEDDLESDNQAVKPLKTDEH